MIRITAAYPRQEGKKFNLEYYLNTHLYRCHADDPGGRNSI